MQTANREEYNQVAYNPESEMRQHYHSLAVGVVLPLVQSAVTGALGGLLVGVVSGALGYGHPWKAGFMSWAVVWGLSWLGLFWRWLDITAALEHLTGLDLNGDNRIGDNLPPPNVRIELVSPDKNHTAIVTLPVEQPKLVELASGLLTGRPFSEAEWTGAGRPFGLRNFRKLRDEMLKRGMLAARNEKSGNGGWILTPPGLAAMRYFASLAGAPYPTLEVHTPDNE